MNSPFAYTGNETYRTTIQTTVNRLFPLPNDMKSEVQFTFWLDTVGKILCVSNEWNCIFLDAGLLPAHKKDQASEIKCFMDTLNLQQRKVTVVARFHLDHGGFDLASSTIGDRSYSRVFGDLDSAVR